MPWSVPFTLGHEAAGTVAALGAAWTGSRSGSRSSSAPRGAAARACNCRTGLENRCVERPERPGGGLGVDGALAEYLLVPSPRLLVSSEGLDPAVAAPLTDAALTPYHAIKQSLHLLVPGSTTVVIGVGGLGHMAVQILRALTPTRIVALDAREAAVQLALASGADEALRLSRARPCRSCRRNSAATGQRSSSTSSASTRRSGSGPRCSATAGTSRSSGSGAGPSRSARGSRSSGP